MFERMSFPARDDIDEVLRPRTPCGRPTHVDQKQDKPLGARGKMRLNFFVDLNDPPRLRVFRDFVH